MTGLCLDELPAELLLDISEYLEATHKPSLKALSLTKKTLLSPTSSILFRKINFHVSSPASCVETVQKWKQILLRRNCLQSVRTIEIDGFMASEDDQIELQQCGYCRGDFGEPILEYGLHDHGHAMNLEAEDDAFLPISMLITDLPHVSDVIWLCHNVVAQCILNTAKDLGPSIRLHVHALRLLHLNTNEIGVRELQILKSQNLHALTVRYIESEMNGEWLDHKPKRIISKLIAGLAPNLKHLTTVGCNHKTFSPDHQSPVLNVNLVEQRTEKFHLARLESLSVSPKMHIDEEDVPIWYNLIDPASLRVLELNASLSNPLVRWLSTNANFHCLEDLTFSFDHHDHPTPVRERPARADDLYAWLLKLPKLTALRLNAPLCPQYIQVFWSALAYHGQTLRELALSPPLYDRVRNDAWSNFEVDTDILEMISQACPNLEELDIPLRRRQFDRTETQLYAALANFSRLTNILLQFDGGCWGLDAIAQDVGQDRTDNDREPWNEIYIGTNVTRGRVKRALINAAVDACLAKQVWTMISLNKVGRALRSLELKTMNSEHNGTAPLDLRQARAFRTHRNDLCAMFQELERSYFVSKGIRDDSDELIVHEVGRAKRESQRWDVCHPNGTEMDLFRSIWPKTGEDSDWRDDWRSFTPAASI